MRRAAASWSTGSATGSSRLAPSTNADRHRQPVPRRLGSLLGDGRCRTSAARRALRVRRLQPTGLCRGRPRHGRRPALRRRAGDGDDGRAAAPRGAGGQGGTAAGVAGDLPHAPRRAVRSGHGAVACRVARLSAGGGALRGGGRALRGSGSGPRDLHRRLCAFRRGTAGIGGDGRGGALAARRTRQSALHSR